MSIPSGPGGLFPIPNTWLEDNTYDPQLNDAMRKVRENFEKMQIAVGSNSHLRTGVSGVIPVTPAFAGGVQSNWNTVSHGLGVTPTLITMQNFYGDSGLWLPFIDYVGTPPTSTTFTFLVRDMLGGAHGPGNLGGIGWLVMA
jgi:hypothetical protein